MVDSFLLHHRFPERIEIGAFELYPKTNNELHRSTLVKIWIPHSGVWGMGSILLWAVLFYSLQQQQCLPPLLLLQNKGAASKSKWWKTMQRLQSVHYLTAEADMIIISCSHGFQSAQRHSNHTKRGKVRVLKNRSKLQYIVTGLCKSLKALSLCRSWSKKRKRVNNWWPLWKSIDETIFSPPLTSSKKRGK